MLGTSRVGLGLSSSLGGLLLGIGVSLGAGSRLGDLVLSVGGSKRVQLAHESSAGGSNASLGRFLGGLLGGSEGRLDLIRVDDSSQISVSHLRSQESVSLLKRSTNLEAAEDFVQLLSGGLSPDDHSSECSSWGSLEKVQSVDMTEVNSWNVTESMDDTVVLSIDHKGSLSGDITSVSSLTRSTTEMAGFLDSVQVSSETQLSEELNSNLCLVDLLEGIINNQWHLRDIRDAVTSGHDQSWKSRGGDGRSHGMSLLGLVGGSMPSSPGLVRGKHVTSTAHISEGTLARSAGTTTGNTGDTSDGSSGSPRLSRSLMTSEFADTISLTSVLGDISVNSSDQIRSQRS